MVRIKKIETDCPEGLFKKAKLDYTNLSIEYGDNINFEYKFSMKPEDYLRFAYADMEDGGDKGLINALSNAKRCIDCLVETVLYSLSFEPDNLHKNALLFCDEFLCEREASLKPNSLRLFCALGFAPSLLISEVRQLRNKVEHEYKTPKLEDVLRAIEVAELLLNNVKAKELYSTGIYISDIKRDAEPKGIGCIEFTEDYLSKKEGKCYFELTVRVEAEGTYKYHFKGNEPIFFYLLRSMFVGYLDQHKLVDTILKMLNKVSISTPLKHVNIVKVHG
ncbi:hypothetical protein [Pseudoalteromonas sp. MMG012]|uniref:hypothetical protein n=1 Tax=Pseudoalteromonas sp. MMG012 TaxID=2822686 RepID=UPI001B3A0907|nr:hypothetical protein [Pseudoalteromonas sp. MMG012]MBQ4849477.1 hypothetical protein [Pseudoalteromonas sp. MMG012]